MRVRSIFVAALALLVAALVVRTAFVAAYATTNPAKAAVLWPGHPSVLFESGLAEIGRTAAAGQKVDRTTIDRLVAAAARSPLAPEPFLVRGVQAQLARDERLAGRAFEEARRRAPRSIAARYFLADHYLRTGQTRNGLGEISVLTRLVPESLNRIAPYLAAYARTDGAASEVKRMLRQHPEIEPYLLDTLAADPRNDLLVRSLWSGRGGESARGWQQRLIVSLVEAGRYEQAHSAWNRFGGGAQRKSGLIDPDFTSRALPPFGWTLASGPAGVAEPEAGGRLHILYYGRDNLQLAEQLLMLKPGQYRLSMRVGGATPAARNLAWTVRCLRASNSLAMVPLSKSGKLAAAFVVPHAGCTAQRLALAGTAPEFPEQSDVTISEFRLQRESGQ